MSENEKREMLEKEAAVFEQELSDKEMEKVSGGAGKQVDACSKTRCAGLTLREEENGCARSECRGNPLREDNQPCSRNVCSGNTLRGD